MRPVRSLGLLLVMASPLLAADWPGWLGPRRDGVSTEKVKPWKGELKAAWRVPVGPGHSSPVIAGGKVYLHARVKDRNAEELICLDARTGKKHWATSYPRDFFFSPFGTGPQATPTVVNGKVFTHGITGVLTCFDAEKGSILWQVDTRKEFKPASLVFGTACSPLVEGNRVILNVGAKGASVVAFDTDTGAVAWKSLDDAPSYSSGIAVGKSAEYQVVFLTQQGLRALAPSDGKVLWEFPLRDKLNESSTTPVMAGGLLLASSISYGMVGLKLDQSGLKAAAKPVWQNKQLTCYFSTPIPVGKKEVYVVTGQMSFTPVSSLHCVDVTTGKIHWTVPKIGKYHAAMLRTADDKLLLLTDLGDLILFQPDPTGFKELARTRVAKGEGIWAHPALSDGKVYFRDDHMLICLQMPE
ncbi:MAG: PQQ-binding-like beta-propeller repeat protein [Gemmataceae bacterium]